MPPAQKIWQETIPTLLVVIALPGVGDVAAPEKSAISKICVRRITFPSR